VISPLLANIYLHWFDKAFHRADGPAQWANAKLVRYADDFVVLARYQSQRLRGFIEDKLEGWLGLTVNREKTRVWNSKNPRRAWTFWLHLPVRPRPPRRQSPVSEPGTFGQGAGSRAGGAAADDRPEQCHTPLPELTKTINRHLNGWGKYFSLGIRARRFGRSTRMFGNG